MNDVIQVAGWPKVFEYKNNSFISFSNKFQVFKMKIIDIKNAKKSFFQNYYLSINECVYNIKEFISSSQDIINEIINTYKIIFFIYCLIKFKNKL